MKAKAPAIGIDIGGTKVAIGLVSPSGKVLAEKREPTRLAGGWPELKTQLVELCRSIQKENSVKARAVGIGSAGPLHAPSGTLLDPTNFGWTKPLKVKVTSELKSVLKIPVHLENDAAAAVLAERWKGGGGKNCVVLTLGTGLGMGVICNGELVRGGRELHPEGGHVLLRAGDRSALCGCGVYGCAEAFLSGKNFEARARVALGESLVTGATLAERAKSGDRRVQALFDEYSQLLAEYLLNLVVLYYPEQVIFTGSFAAAHPHFLPKAEEKLREFLHRRLRTLPLLPKLRVSRLGNSAGIIGAAFVGFHPIPARGAAR